MVRIAVAGLGAQGRLYAQLITGQIPDLELAALCATNPRSTRVESHREFAATHGVPLFTSFTEMLDSGTVDAVVITTPHWSHPGLATDAITRGIHVLLEKPAGVTSQSVVRLAATAAAHPQASIAMMFNQRANPLYRDLHGLISSGALGRLRHTNWMITHWWRPDAYYNSSSWRASWAGEGGGILVNQAPHQLDLWQWLCGNVQRCFSRARFGFRRDIEVEDEVSALVEFPDGATGTLTTCTNDLVGTDRLELLFDEGKVIVDDSADVTVWRYVDDERAIARSISPADAALVPSGVFDRSSFHSATTTHYESPWGVQHALALQNFAEHIADGTPLFAGLAEGLAQVRLANAMHLSAWTGADIDLVNFDDDAYAQALAEKITAAGNHSHR
ncbi:hypothetical protein HMPREF1531_02373 [Propionibacterium sp. oral taxon 192 str. F0372]|uniref:Gfo/Idh/MocA family protein n=1 Tax=Propionibacterium sp. oral taxon 192 TaxID=671222 RepID=UPI0003533A92|nr:Gfo/Idh/MocA family oxidoreductase [Propionibacterium sp. oral taxon 192]EPH00265.1 hypothetical protein HMPREF1531_02373 [Propionibacterium sp. oral taxon 192 str. F0372]